MSTKVGHRRPAAAAPDAAAALDWSATVPRGLPSPFHSQRPTHKGDGGAKKKAKASAERPAELARPPGGKLYFLLKRKVGTACCDLLPAGNWEAPGETTHCPHCCCPAANACAGRRADGGADRGGAPHHRGHHRPGAPGAEQEGHCCDAGAGVGAWRMCSAGAGPGSAPRRSSLAADLFAAPALQEGDDVLFYQSPPTQKDKNFRPSITALCSVARGVRPLWQGRLLGGGAWLGLPPFLRGARARLRRLDASPPQCPGVPAAVPRPRGHGRQRLAGI